ncbi:MAG: 3-oxoacyl-ACP reductase [Bacteroidetes bacterium]|nr:3-oxoacyl-ACP reductase [Bacteroidota bacterium]
MNFIVTGISKGVGLEITKVLISKGHTIFGISRNSSAELDELRKTYPENLKWRSYDLTDHRSIRDELFKSFIGLKTEIHGYVNNAALAYDDIITNLNNDPLEKMFKVNVYSPFNITKNVIRSMLLHQIKGSIVHLSSISVHTGYKGLSMYASTKGALEAFSKNTAREWGSLGIRSNTIVAGFMETEMSSTLSDKQRNRIFERTSLKKPTSLNSVAKTVAYLLEEDSISITGQNIHVDSGTI